MERIEVSTITRQFKRTFDEGMLNELGNGPGYVSVNEP